MQRRHRRAALLLLGLSASAQACHAALLTKPASAAPLTASAMLEREGREALAGNAALRTALERERQRILGGLVEERRLQSAVPVSEEDLRRYHAEHPAEFDQPEKLDLRHVFKRVPRQASDAERRNARTEIEAILERLRSGADFDKLAHESSDSETAQHGGQIAPQARGDLPPAIDTVVWRLKVGELSDVVETPAGFHVFRLEAIRPPLKVPFEEARATILRKLTAARNRESIDACFQELLRDSGAAYHPEALHERPPQGDPLLFALDSRRIRLQDVRAEWETLPFARQRLETLGEVLQSAALRELYDWEAGRRGLEAQPDVASQLAAAKARLLADWAYEQRLARRLRQSGAALSALFQEHPGRFARVPEYRLRLLTRRYPGDRVPYAAYDDLAKLALEIRSGARDFASAARESSDDPSGRDGGELGFVSLTDFASWAGFEAGGKLGALKPGIVSDPILIEVYEPERLRHRRDGYMLVLVEEVRPGGPAQSLDEVRAQVEQGYAALHAQKLRAEIEAEVLREHAR